MELGGDGEGHPGEGLALSPRLSCQSPASEGEEEELLMEEEEEEVLAGVSAEDKGRRPPVKGPSEPAHPGERRGRGVGDTGRAELGRGGSWGQGWPFSSVIPGVWLTA